MLMRRTRFFHRKFRVTAYQCLSASYVSMSAMDASSRYPRKCTSTSSRSQWQHLRQVLYSSGYIWNDYFFLD
ncbi:hypothetical protein T4A_11604 [Trichinella pseudospiralis]|uniref:Uncharacterized protein n=1 Tax=Trichinella pseudospiralis TaxID=6337 RepID=A0A0V1E713_TRIPS|nr:hypothetical protein T4A_11604 [Trichinella pseudospiralis]KRY88742.1 hypothetical protein T4D_7296 [Trichinella pseudospiralis]